MGHALHWLWRQLCSSRSGMGCFCKVRERSWKRDWQRAIDRIPSYSAHKLVGICFRDQYRYVTKRSAYARNVFALGQLRYRYRNLPISKLGGSYDADRECGSLRELRSIHSQSALFFLSTGLHFYDMRSSSERRYWLELVEGMHNLGDVPHRLLGCPDAAISHRWARYCRGALCQRHG